MTEDSVGFISRCYQIEPVDFDRGERAALICAGSGLMLAIMDQCPRLRWCIDVDALDRSALERMPAWVTCIGNVTELVVIAGWYCSTNPKPLASAARALAPLRMRCYVQCHGVGGDPFIDLRTAATLSELIDQVNTSSCGGLKRPS
jgi:hypothetical protein